MQFILDNKSNRPVYQQIIDQVKRDVAFGRLRAGEKLPTVRELADALAINPNTIGKAYRQLESEGIISTRPGAGAFVAEIESHLNGKVKKRIICGELERALVDAFHMNIDKETLLGWFETVLENFNFDKRED